MNYRRLTRVMRTKFRDDEGSPEIGKAQDIMKQKIELDIDSSSKPQPLLAENEASKRMLKRVQKLMHDAIHVKNPLVPDKTLTQLREEYVHLSWQDRRRAFKLLSDEFGVDRQRVKDLMQHYLSLSSENPDSATLSALYRTERDLRTALVPLSARLFEHMNTQIDGLKFLVDFRADLLSLLREDNVVALQALDSHLQGLFSSWLSPACLELHQITWDDSAALLEKIVRYEAVHPINNLYDLKRRLGTGRRCFGYFHPAMPGLGFIWHPCSSLCVRACSGEPLVFIEVALAESISDSIQDLLFEKPPIPETDATTAMFYSISSTQPGLAGIDLGNFLIKRVLRLLQQDMSHVQTFATLSPIPGFMKWLLPKLASQSRLAEGKPGGSVFKEDLLLPHENQAILEASEGNEQDGLKVLCNILSAPDAQWIQKDNLRRALRPPLMRLCARYLLQEKKRGKALDPVANFHLRNGASIERLNWMANLSVKGLKESAGMMVNYLYRPETIEANNYDYINQGTIQASSQFSVFDLPSAL